MLVPRLNTLLTVGAFHVHCVNFRERNAFRVRCINFWECVARTTVEPITTSVGLAQARPNDYASDALLYSY